MKSKHLIIPLLFLLNLHLLYGQKEHELKLSLTGLLSKSYIPHYELIVAKQLGVELTLGFDFSKKYLPEYRMSAMSNKKFSATQFNPSIGGKYYFLLNKQHGSGLFAGPYIRLNYLLSREDGYVETWEHINGIEAPERLLTNKGAKHLYYGLNGGFKWLIKTKFIAEFVMTWTVDKFVGKGASEFDDLTTFRGESYLKIGYRF